MGLLTDVLGGLVDITEEIIESPVNFDIDVDSDVDRFYFQWLDFDLVSGARQQQPGQGRTSQQQAGMTPFHFICFP
jgi:hypothetical protein